MKKIYSFLITLLAISTAFGQDPYIGTSGGDGLGQYGYLEKDAVTFSRLFRNTYNNIAFLSARWWVTDNNNGNGNGIEYIYHVYDFPISQGGDWDPLVGWQCGGDNSGSKRAKDYAAADFGQEWRAGSDCYISICSKYCDNSFYPPSFDGTSTFGAVGFNERHLQVIDIDTTLHISTATDIPDGSGVCDIVNPTHVAGSFTIDPGSLAGISLTTLILKNNGTAIEVTDIPNTALNIFYEPANGTEIFNGNENFAGTLSGNWDGNASDNIYGSTSLNIPLNGKVRVYVLLCDFNSLVAIGKEINMGIVNDGISLSPSLDTYSKLRINAGSISQRNITLPVKILGLTGQRKNETVELKWQADGLEHTDNFVIQQSYDGIYFTDVKTISVNEYVRQMGYYQFRLFTGAGYFRISLMRNSVTHASSNVIAIPNGQKAGLVLLQDPVRDKILLESSFTTSGNYLVLLTDASGKVLFKKNMVIQPGLNAVPLPAVTASQVLILLTKNINDGSSQDFKILPQ